MRSEGDVKKEIRKVLDAVVGLWYFMPAANGFGAPGIPDFVGAYKGKAFTIEAKFGSGKQSMWQKKQQKLISASGTPYLLIDEHNVVILLGLLGIRVGEAHC